jgi:uncharacterized protein YcbX
VSGIPRLARIVVYPIKALDGVEVGAVRVLGNGALEGDRELALVDGEGGFVNVKRDPELTRVRSAFDLGARSVSLSLAGFDDVERFSFERDEAALAGWFSDYLGRTLTLERDPAGGFPDDTLRPGPTVVGAATLAAVAGWFEGITPAAMGRRIRANLELGGCEAFWEDRLYGPPGAPVAFRLGEVPLLGVKPCVRCTVPTRDPDSGEALPGFQSRFEARRRETLPAFAEPRALETFYVLAVNTRAASPSGGELRVGDLLTLP